MEVESGLQEGPGQGEAILMWRRILHFNCIIFIIVKSYEADVNGALYALLCYLVLIKSGIVRDVPRPRKTSLHSSWWHRATPQVVQCSGRENRAASQGLRLVFPFEL